MSLLKVCSLFVVISFSSPSIAKSQNTINGTIRSEASELLANVNVLIHPQYKTNLIIAFGFTNEQGEFSISVPSKYDSIALSTKTLSYRDTLIRLKNELQTLSIYLPYHAKQIKEVLVKRSSISAKGDTLTYLVKSFAKGKDLSIGDVISNMPGFDVTPEGQVYYQGKPIQKYYIEGMDLLEGNYAIANKNLPHSSVGAVEVMENHQPIRMLHGVISSNETSINIKLKKDVAITGNAQLGAGYTPFLHDINITPMLFSPRQQAILTWQSNNTGEDLSTQFKPVQSGTVVVSGLDNSGNKLLGISAILKPNIETQRYLYNSANLLTYNHLVKLSSTAELKINTRYLSDYVDEEELTSTNYFLPDSTISYAERTINRYLKSDAGAAISYSQNAAKKYIKNSFSVNHYSDSEKGGINTGNNIWASAKTPSFNTSNEFDIMFSKRKSFYGVYSKVLFEKLPQQSSISPGVFSDILNNGVEYERTTQKLERNSFTTHNYLKFAHSIKKWLFSSEIGLKYENHQYNSHIDVDGNLLLEDSLRNSIDWIYFEQYVDETINWEGNRLKVIVDLPLSFFRYKIDSKYSNNPDDIQRYILNPGLSLKLNINGHWSTALSAGFSDSYDNPSNLTKGYTINGYNSLQSKYSELGERKSRYGRLYLQYKNPILGLFISSNYIRRQVNRDFLTKRNMVDYGVFVNEIVKVGNKSMSDNLSTNISWYFSGIYTTLGLKTNISQNVGDYIFNDKKSQSTINMYLLNPSIGISRWRTVGIDYNYQFSIIKQHSSRITISIYEQKHKWSIYFYPNNSHYLGFDVELYNTKQKSQNLSSNLFTNLVYSFKPSKSKLQLYAWCNNIFNRSVINQYNSSDNVLVLSRYLVRPREFMVSVTIPLTSANGLK